jgi:ABC-2 type transport system ATP-binding protein
MTAAVEVSDLTKDYGDLLALDGVSLRVEPGDVLTLVGPNGSGKTTLLRIVAGLLEPTGGEATVCGHPVGSYEARAALAFIPDAPVLYDDLDVMEHLEYISGLHRVSDWEPGATTLVERLGLAERADDLPSRFSRGLRQKVSLALAFVRPFEVVLVDEPFVGLDAAGRTTFCELLAEAVAGGAAALVATHLPEALGMATRTIGLADGRVVEAV